MQSINPFSGKIIQTYREYTTGEVSTIIQQVDVSWRQWKQTSFGRRCAADEEPAIEIARKQREVGRIDDCRNGESIPRGIGRDRKMRPWFAAIMPKTVKRSSKMNRSKQKPPKLISPFNPSAPFWR